MYFRNRNYIAIYELINDKRWSVGTVYIRKTKQKRDFLLPIEKFLEIMLTEGNADSREGRRHGLN